MSERSQRGKMEMSVNCEALINKSKPKCTYVEEVEGGDGEKGEYFCTKRRSECHYCSHIYEAQEIAEPDIDDFSQFLQGQYMPWNLNMSHPPKMTKAMANKIIYYLQEILGVLPDKYDMCKTCGIMYDSANEGSSKEGRCGSCWSSHWEAEMDWRE